MEKAKKMFNKYWIVGLALLAIAIVAIIGAKQGWFTPKARTIDPTTAAQDGSSQTISDNVAHNLAVGLRDTFHNHWLYYDNDTAIAVMRPIYDLSDADLIVVSNKYNSLFANDAVKTNRSMRSILQAENLGWFFGEANELRDELVVRLNKLGA